MRILQILNEDFHCETSVILPLEPGFRYGGWKYAIVTEQTIPIIVNQCFNG